MDESMSIDSDFEPECANDPDLFFATDFTSIKKAKTVCGRCPAREACEEAGQAVYHENTDVKFNSYGVWGGVSALERYGKAVIHVSAAPDLFEGHL